jgi:dihydropteroate synthase
MNLPPPGIDVVALQTRHGEIRFDRRTAIMGILNLTPDSFYDGGRRFDPAKAVADALALVEAGADIIDIGGESTRPGAEPVPAEEELRRVLPVIRALRPQAEMPLSIDTYKAEVARQALAEGVDIVNDISALSFDPDMGSVVATERVPVVLMHMQGEPRSMQKQPRYHDVVAEVHDFLAARIEAALAQGIERANIVIDPGIGFGKTLEHNYALLRHLPSFASLGQPLLVGASRKAFIGRVLDIADADHRLEGSLAAAVAAVLGGAHIVRVHDVRETRRALAVADAVRFGIA